MNSLVMTVVANMRHKKLTAYQASIVIKEVLGPKLEIGFRHANIPLPKIIEWDKYISGALTNILQLSSARLHKSAIYTALGTSTLEDHYLVVKAVHLLESATAGSELRTHYRDRLAQAIVGGLPGSEEESTLAKLETHGISLCENPQSATADWMLEKRGQLLSPGDIDYIAAHQRTGKKGNRMLYLVYEHGTDNPRG